MNIKEKIERLLALAERGTEHEAASAAEKAANLMAKYGIERASLNPQDRKDEPVKVGVLWQSPNSAVPTWIGVLSIAVQHLFNVEVIRSGTRVLAVGRSTDLEVARLVLATYIQAIARGARRAKQADGLLGRSQLNSYRVGSASEISRRAREASLKYQSEASGEGIIVFDSDRRIVRDAFAKKFPNAITKSKVAARNNAGLAAGRRDGKNISLGHNATLGGRLALGTS